MKGLFVLMVFCLFVPLADVSPGEGTPPAIRTTYLSGHITVDTVYPADTYIVTGNVYVDDGVTVEFLSGADVRFSNPNHGFYIYGSLILNGTRQGPVYFRHESLEPTPGGYMGIIFMPGSSGSISHATITDAVTGVTVRGSGSPPYVEVRDSEVAHCSDAGIRIDVAYLIPSPSFPYQNRIIDTTIRNCPVGIKDNGIGTVIESCIFRYNSEYGIYLGHDPNYPRAQSATIRGNTFNRNGGANLQYTTADDLYINGTDDPEDFKDLVIYHNEFYHFAYGYPVYAKGLLRNLRLEGNHFRGFHPSLHSPVIIKSVQGAQILSNAFGNGSGLSINHFRDLTVDNNYFWGTLGEYSHLASSGVGISNGENLIFTNNTYEKTRFYENSGDIAFVFRIRNVTGVEISGNAIYNFTSTHRFSSTAFTVELSAPVLFRNNMIRGCRDEGIWISSSAYQDVLGEVTVVNNTVEDCGKAGLSLEGNEVTRVKGLKVINCSTGISIDLDIGYISMVQEDILIEDSTILETRISFELDRFVYSGETRTVYVRNTIFNATERAVFGRACDAAVEVTQYLRVRAYDDLLRPAEVHLRVWNVSGSSIYDGDISGVSPVIEGPPLRYYFDESRDYRFAEVNFTDVNLIYEVEGRATVQGTVNLTSSTELDLLVDGSPLYQGPSSVSFSEDFNLLIDPALWFWDLDPMVFEVAGAGPELRVDGFNITNAQENWYGQSWILLKATDSWGNYTVVNLTVDVLPFEDPPEITPPFEDIYMDEDTSYTLNLSAHMYDADGDPLTWRVEGGKNLTLELDPSGWVLTITPMKEYFGVELITLYLSDGEIEVSGTIRVHVNHVNDPPVFSPPENWTVVVERGVEFRLDLSDYVTDVDSPQLTFMAVSDYAAVEGDDLVILVPKASTASIFNIRITVSDNEGGSDSAVLTVRVVAHWNITSAAVTVDKDGNWRVEVRGEENLTVYIVIDGVGSFLLEETEKGVYYKEIPGEEFEEGKTYSYHFSDREGGEDMAPQLSSGITQPARPGGEGGEGRTLLYIAIIVILLVALAAVLLMKRGGGGGIEE